MRLLIVASLLAFTSTAATSHSGGTDQYGCHKDHKTGDYHCHNPKR
jgi:hypothetical protein